MDVGGARNPSQIVEFYKGKTIFLTGVTGFLGKILLAQLFQRCPGVKRVICLIRGRQGVSASARFEKEVFALELFANLIKKDPSIKDKVYVRKQPSLSLPSFPPVLPTTWVLTILYRLCLCLVPIFG